MAKKTDEKKCDYVGRLPVFIKEKTDKNGNPFLTISFPNVLNAFPTKDEKAEDK